MKESLKSGTISLMDVVKAPNVRLRVETKPVKKITPGLLSTTKQMIKLTKTFKDPEGVGLASTQIGLEERFFVAKIGEEFVPFFNPEILSFTKATKVRFEGCLSIPDHYGDVNRALGIRVRYMDEKGKLVIRPLKSVAAWIFQHEMDHINGILFPDRVLEQGGKFYKWIGRDPKTGDDHFEEVII